VTATNDLAASLDASMAANSSQIQSSRIATRKFWYSSYIDLFDFSDHIYNNITDATIRANAQAVQSAVNDFVLFERHSANQAGSHGVSIFFPGDSSSFYNPSRYDFAVGAVWPGAATSSREGFSNDEEGWGALLTHYIQTFPGGPDVSEPPLPVSPQDAVELFLPMLIR
jgi:hypothetical protein